jgi:pimeloyl-ACP methyl ester carboxylesterase
VQTRFESMCIESETTVSSKPMSRARGPVLVCITILMLATPSVGASASSSDSSGSGDAGFVPVLGRATATERAEKATRRLPRVKCRELGIPVALTGSRRNQTIYAELCSSDGKSTPTVQILVPGGSYGLIYWDFPSIGGRNYSYAKYAVQRGYTTLAIDRIGTGRSSHPFSAQIDLNTNAYILHQIVQRLRRDGLGSRPFEKVVIVGHSYGSFTSWVEAAKYQDVDAVLDTGAMHLPNPLGVAMIARYLTKPAMLERRFRGLDPGYLTTWANGRAPLFYRLSNADPRVVALDERTKETITLTELATFLPSALDGTTRRINVPVLLVAGEYDAVFCGLTAANCASSSTLRRSEAPYYSPKACLKTYVLPNAGHDINLHLNARNWFRIGIDWIDARVGRGGADAPGCP